MGIQNDMSLVSILYKKELNLMGEWVKIPLLPKQSKIKGAGQ